MLENDFKIRFSIWRTYIGIFDLIMYTSLAYFEKTSF